MLGTGVGDAVHGEPIGQKAPTVVSRPALDYGDKANGTRKAGKKAKAAKKAQRAKKAANKPKADRANKKAEVIAMMKRAKGATLLLYLP